MAHEDQNKAAPDGTATSLNMDEVRQRILKILDDLEVELEKAAAILEEENRQSAPLGSLNGSALSLNPEGV